MDSLQDLKISGTEEHLEMKLKRGSVEIYTIISLERLKGKKPYFISNVNFYNDGQRIQEDLQELAEDQQQQKQISELIEEYASKISSFDQMQFNEVIKESDQSSKGSSRLTLRFIEHAKKIFLDVQIATIGLNILTVDNNKNIMIRTAIELDADVITILRPDINDFQPYRKRILMVVHAINVSFVNKFLKFRLTRFIHSIRSAVSKSKKTVAAAGTALTLTDFYMTSLHNLNNIQQNALMQLAGPTILQQIAIPIGTYLAYRYYGRILFFILRFYLKKQLK